MKRIDLTGKRFDKLVCLMDVGLDRHHSHLWLCLCDCGNHVIKRAGIFAAQNQHVFACKLCGLQAMQANRIKHGATIGKPTPLYIAWSNMRARCRAKTPKNKYWAGRGIKVWEPWNDYKTFEGWALGNGYKPGLAIDRVDANRDYLPDNCRWVTVSQNTVFSLDRRYGRG